MSAYIVSTGHIRYLVTAAVDYSREYGGRISFYHAGERREIEPDALGRMLQDENAASTNYRYDRTTAPDGYQHRRSPMPITPVQVIKAVHCYRYQACEHEAWEASAANAFSKWLIDQATRALPGYDLAEWHIDETAFAEAVAAKRAEIRARTTAAWEAAHPAAQESAPCFYCGAENTPGHDCATSAGWTT